MPMHPRSSMKNMGYCVVDVVLLLFDVVSGEVNCLQLQHCIAITLTCRRPSSERGIVTHFDGIPGADSARSRSSMAPFRFFNFLTKLSTAFSAHFSSSSPCFQPSNFFTAGLVNENKLFKFDIVLLVDSRSSVSILRRCFYWFDSLAAHARAIVKEKTKKEEKM